MQFDEMTRPCAGRGAVLRNVVLALRRPQVLQLFDPDRAGVGQFKEGLLLFRHRMFGGGEAFSQGRDATPALLLTMQLQPFPLL